MNKIIKNEEGYVLVCETGEQFECKVIFDKKTNKNYVKLPTNNPSGRTFVVESIFDNVNEYQFETKTEHRSGMSWKSKLTEQEKDELKELEERIEEIKQTAMKRQTPKVTKEDKLLKQIEEQKQEIEELKKLLEDK